MNFNFKNLLIEEVQKSINIYMASQRRMHKHGNRKGGDSSALRHPDLTVFGYASKLYEQINATMDGGCGGGPMVDEDKYLIPWNGDEQLKIDRYDARLYLTSLDEFNEPKGSSSKNEEEKEEEESPENLAEKLEEELCEEQRYMDFYAAMKSAEIEEEKRKQAVKKTEIGFNYDQVEQIDAKEEENEKEEEIEPEDDEPFEKPESLKLPVGIVTPETMRQNALIERTAAFIVSKGPQMEVVIKAKQRQRAEQFDFLDFDHRLHPYYKYLCKLIREKKYTPNLTRTPMRTAKSKPVVRQQNSPESDDNKNDSSDESDDDNDNGYLHPLLRGGAGTAAANSPGNGGFIGPEQKPIAQKIQKKIDQPKVEPMPHQMIHSNANENSLYSSLMKGLHAVLPKKEEKSTEIADENEKIQEQSPKPAATKTNGGEEMQFETNIERIKDYNKWHLEFYGRPSPYLPGPPPIALPPLPDSAVESGITVAAKYVALHGASAEQRLIEHNGDKVHFLLARSRYYTFYQASVRHLQWKLFQQSQKMQQKQQQQISPAPMPPISLLEQISPLPPILQPSNSPSGNVPIEIKARELPLIQEEMASTNLTDKKQQERKEKARLFMERILNERLAEKHKKGTTTKESTDGNEANLEEERRRPKKRRSGFDDSGGAEISTPTEPIAGPSAFSPSQLSKTISSLVDQQLQRTFATSSEGPSTSSNSMKRRKKEKNRKKSSESSENDDSGNENDGNRRRNGKREKKGRGGGESEDEDDGGEDKKGSRRRKQQGHRNQRSRRDSRSNERRRRHKKSSRHSSRSSSSSSSTSSRN